MSESLRIAAVQFEHRDGSKNANLERIHALTAQAVLRGADVVSFHECCISGYSFVQSMSMPELVELAEELPVSSSLQKLHEISREHGVPVLAGLFERARISQPLSSPVTPAHAADSSSGIAGDWQVFNTYVCVDGDELVARFRKLHAFVNPLLSSGNEFCVFTLRGWQCGILICYDNNLPENVRITTLKGAKVIFMPHVTGCLPSVMPGRGTVAPELWDRREVDPVPLRQEFAGPKGRGWLMRWLPARAWENGIYAVFSNPIGRDYDEIRNGNAMVLDPFGEVIAECHELGDDLCIGVCSREKLALSSGTRYLKARRPDLYHELTRSTGTPPITEPGWQRKARKLL